MEIKNIKLEIYVPEEYVGPLRDALTAIPMSAPKTRSAPEAK